MLVPHKMTALKEPVACQDRLKARSRDEQRGIIAYAQGQPPAAFEGRSFRDSLNQLIFPGFHLVLLRESWQGPFYPGTRLVYRGKSRVPVLLYRWTVLLRLFFVQTNTGLTACSTKFSIGHSRNRHFRFRSDLQAGYRV